MWTCPYCANEYMYPTTSRSRHLKNKAGCKEEHAKHLAKEAEKQEELKAKRMALFRSSAAAPGQSESDAGPAEAPPSKGANLGKQGAQNSNLGSFSGLLESMVQYYWSSSLLQNPATASTKEQEGASKNQAGPNPAFKLLLFIRSWRWLAQQSIFSRRFAPHFPSRAINSTPK